MVKVSVVTMTYNNIGTIKQFLKSLEKQTFKDFELIAVDSESNDGTKELLEKAGARMVNLPKKDFSFGKGRNLGISKSKGDIIAFLSADAEAEKNWLKTIVEKFKDKNLVFLFGKQIHKSNEKNIVTLSRKMRYNIYWEMKDDLVLDESTVFYASTVNSACRKSVKFDEKLPAAEDRAAAIKLLRQGKKMIYCPECVAYHLESMNMREEIRKMKREGKGDRILIGKYRIFGKIKFWRYCAVFGLITSPLYIFFPFLFVLYLAALYFPSFQRLLKYIKNFSFEFMAIPASIVGMLLDLVIAVSFVGGRK